MKVGDYVRIENKVGCCYIGKIYNINDYREPSTKYCIDIQAKDFVFIGEEAICKSSPNIIDLIEVGDYVNGEEVKEKFNYLLGFECGQDGEYYRDEKDIKSVVTKEQFSQMEYRLEEK